MSLVLCLPKNIVKLQIFIGNADGCGQVACKSSVGHHMVCSNLFVFGFVILGHTFHVCSQLGRVIGVIAKCYQLGRSFLMYSQLVCSRTIDNKGQDHCVLINVVKWLHLKKIMMNVKYPFMLKYIRYVAYDFSIFLNQNTK